MLRLQSLDIRQFRGLAPGGTLHFSPTMNVLLGQNASGKTTLLELLVAVLKGSFKAYAQEPLDLSYMMVDDETQAVIRVTYRNTVSDNVLTSDLARAAGLVTPASSFDATLSITFTNGTVFEVVTDGRSTKFLRDSQRLRTSESAPDRATLVLEMFWELNKVADDPDSAAKIRTLFSKLVCLLRNLRRFDEGPARSTTWKGTDSQHDRLRVALVREIATTVAQENSHVLFHIDGDRMWAKRSSYTAAATKICTEEYQGKDADVFEGWSKDRGQLDEVECPKEKTCLSSKHNGELATTSFPAADVIAAGKSFATCLDQMRASDPLVADLAATH